ncbi:MAG: hypothetical protein M1480_06240 [Bacteroidetes bacterium]|nr:hypothetical protein [Bacteroidota bacterium]
MENTEQAKCRLSLIEEFINNNRDIYLKMIDWAQSMLCDFLGPQFIKSNTGEGIMHEVIGDLIDGTRKWEINKFTPEQMLWGNGDLIDGTRKWEINKFTPEQMLWGNIKSEVSNVAKKEIRLVPTGKPPGDNDEYNDDIDTIINTSPEDVEGEIDADEIENYCRDVILKDDIDAQIIFNEMLTGKTQKQIAEYLGLNTDTIESSIRTIRRKISRQFPRHLLQNLPIDLKLKILNYK